MKSTMQKSFFFTALLAISTLLPLAAQGPQGGNFDPSKMNIGRMYGRVVDEAGKGVGYATVQLFGKKFDPQTQTLRDTTWAGQLSEDNGDFNLEKLPVVGEFELVISFLGYTEVRQKVDFGIKAPAASLGGGKPSGPSPGGGFPGAGMGSFEKDLGNIKLLEGATVLSEVVVKGQVATTTLALDRKAYRVDKDLSAEIGRASCRERV